MGECLSGKPADGSYKLTRPDRDITEKGNMKVAWLVVIVIGIVGAAWGLSQAGDSQRGYGALAGGLAMIGVIGMIIPQIWEKEK